MLLANPKRLKTHIGWPCHAKVYIHMPADRRSAIVAGLSPISCLLLANTTHYFGIGVGTSEAKADRNRQVETQSRSQLSEVSTFISVLDALRKLCFHLSPNYLEPRPVATCVGCSSSKNYLHRKLGRRDTVEASFSGRMALRITTIPLFNLISGSS